MSEAALLPREIEVIRLGRVGYAEGTERMQRRVEARTKGEVPDALFLLEHEPVLTLGRGADPSHVMVSPRRLAQLGIELVRTGRGGDVTYHGPGQVVGYPVIDLKPERQSVRRYINDLTDVMAEACADFGVRAGRQPDMVGAWVEPETPRARKIGAIGVRIAQWVTAHGFALNVTEAPLEDFKLIVPCGISEYGVTCLQHEAAAPPTVEQAMDRLEAAFRARFGQRAAAG